MMKRRHTPQQEGFTIVELMIALAFLSFMLLFVVSATVSIMRSYNKGLTVKQINQTGRSITEELARTARGAWAESVFDEADNGRLCVGGVSYIWNEPNVAGETPIAGNLYADVAGTPVGIVRIDDQNQRYCRDTTLRIPLPDDDSSVSVVAGDSVRILGMEVGQSEDNRLLSLNFHVSSAGIDSPQKVGDSYQCPTDGGALFGTFCAIADFETTVYLRNKNGE